MPDQNKIHQLQQQIDMLLRQQARFAAEISRMQSDLDELRKADTETTEPVPVAPVAETKASVPFFDATDLATPIKPFAKAPPSAEEATPPSTRLDWEQYIGGNLINKIGIVVLLIGLGLFVKYAIDQGLFPPPVRVILSYLAGVVLISLAWHFREKYITYSAVLFGGGMAVLYFTSYIGSSFFDQPVVPVIPAFILMAVLMAVTIVVAGRYDAQIIGVLGLGGAYGVPFLVDTGSEDFLIFFSYITLINIGVLILAARKGWRTMTWFACILTWVIAFASLITDGSALESSPEMWIFAIVSFFIFYAAILAHQLRVPQKINTETYLLTGINGFLFYVLTMFLSAGFLSSGGLTFLHALPHFAVAYLMWKKLDHRFPVTFFSMLGVLLVTMGILIEFEQRTVIWLWTAEAILLFFIARKYLSRTFEITAWTLGILTVLALMGGWESIYSDKAGAVPVFFNLHFATHLWVLAGAFAFYLLHEKMPAGRSAQALGTVLKIIPGVLLYFLFFNEIYHWFALQPEPATTAGNYLSQYRSIWLFNYSSLFLTVLGVLNLRRWQHEQLGTFISSAGILAITGFLTIYMQELNFLRDEYLTFNYAVSDWMPGIRYICYAFFAALAVVTLRTLKDLKMIADLEQYLPLLPHLLLLVILSHELVTVSFLILGTTESEIPYREGLSILWGVYSLLLIGLGILKKSKVLRVAGICLFGVTLAKVFFMDLHNLSIISRTMIFIGLGVLLLFTSYLYQKFKDKL